MWDGPLRSQEEPVVDLGVKNDVDMTGAACSEPVSDGPNRASPTRGVKVFQEPIPSLNRPRPWLDLQMTKFEYM